MAEEVTLPQLGESVTEGVVTQWLVEVGDEVEVDQPIVEISTDKVDTEIPSPVAGVVQELKAEIDQEVQVGSVIAIIGEGEAPAGDGEPEDEQAEQPDGGAAAEDVEPKAAGDGEPSADGGGGDAAPATPAPARPEQPAAQQQAPSGDGEAVLTSPLVRKLLREADIDPSQVEGTGPGGRITREDAERAVAEGPSRPAAEPTPAAAGEGRAPSQMPAFQAPRVPERPEAGSVQVDFEGEREKVHDLSRIRKAIARGMHESLQSTAQLTAIVEVDMTRVMATRQQAKDAFKAREGVSLSPLPFVARAVCMVMSRHPAMNSSMDMEAGTATFHSYINLGMAVDTEAGLIVPNIKDAQDLTIPGLARRITEVASKARNKKLTPDDISGATFTVTNTGSRGVMMDTPILNPPEVGILATTLIEKRPIVVTDEMGMDHLAIRHMSYLCLTYDHRMVDGADSARFLGDLKFTLEHTDFGPEVGLQSVTQGP